MAAVACGFFDGAGSFDTLTLPIKDFDGTTVRTFVAKLDEWSICWVKSRRGLDPVPVVGRFVDGAGT
ncbi:hypothetical protein Ssi03_08520 [Sphaerisporangium siamense]|uniref:Uncharacterized protein n=1 Tax=Sphaerisporangium siamense TaxID=795645 RepID=A0A7W7DFD8_9ACTN|nr:hypothetical protein [Sphaerisporangium siamense]MBB4705752.1 hypothetical protein [Sphaerisporangium siamense]GII82862.1 hypothetical protein Ssi03_08520 [Sphaerisporangium siamense]